MDEIKELTLKELNLVAAETGFQRDLIVKDYYLSVMLYFLRDIKGIFFKGGTALQKTMLDYSRISEDIDFTLERNLETVKVEITSTLNKTKMFGKISKDKDVTMFTRLIVPYENELGKDEIFIDLNERCELLQKPELLEQKHFYEGIPKYKFNCLSKEEMIAEKVAVAIGRNKPRDHYDIYQIIKHKLPIDMKMVAKKCLKSGNDPDITKMFNRAKKLHKRWNEDLFPLIKDDVTFQEVMQTLAKRFDLKEEKDKKKDP